VTVSVMPAVAMSEAEFQAAVVALAEINGWRVLHVRKSLGRRDGAVAWQTTTNLKGWPDLLMWRPGRRIVAAELKSDRGRVTAEQSDVLESLAAADVATYVWRPRDLDRIAVVLGRGGRENTIEEGDT